jgi:large subunit ribosomal protein L21
MWQAVMFAVIKTGGKQYRVAEGDEITIEKLPQAAGEKITFGDVLMIGDGGTVAVGAPTVAGASVVGELIDTRKGDKVKVFKKKRRNTYRRKRGHRQFESVVRITQVVKA